MKFKIEYEFETEFNVEDKTELTKTQIKELEEESNTNVQQYGLFDLIEES